MTKPLRRAHRIAWVLLSLLLPLLLVIALMSRRAGPSNPTLAWETAR